MIRHLYFHIPFCAKLCPYCSFHVETAMRNKTPRFLDALLRDVEMRAGEFGLQPRTIYFGGGTPSALSLSQIDYLLTQLRERLDLSAVEEWTFEINPATVSPEKARLLHSLGVSRISMGVQSWNDATLRTLGRSHTAAQSERTFHTLRETGFENISLDLMFGVPGETADSWTRSLDKTIALNPEHVSAYCLTYEEDTAFFERLNAREFRQDEERDATFFEMAMATLAAAGYAHYEISNYARPGRESLHNSAYWSGLDHLGIGPSAFSTVGPRRWQNVCDSVAYADGILARVPRIAFAEDLPAATKTAELLAFGIRTSRGVAREATVRWNDQMREYYDLGFLADAGDRVVLTDRGKLMADRIGATFV